MAAPEAALGLVAYWREAGPERWFRKNAEFDADFRRRYEPLHFDAARRRLDAWAGTADGALGLVLLLDQFPRNAYRGTGHMYATDPLARHFAVLAVGRGDDRAVDPALRFFFYLPFAHSERLDDQDRSVELHRTIGDTSHAEGHRDVIRRFGRFPHRNPMLGRETTVDEQAFLDAGGFAG